ncbi:MAG: hypothetical protein IPP48_08815 [Chitinophagaceae bacterium]|nr:hypothetical protein [Chitinophagaceae bacterium]
MAIFLKNEIGFSTLQIKQYDSLHQLHKEKMKADFDAMKMSKEQQFICRYSYKKYRQTKAN